MLQYAVGETRETYTRSRRGESQGALFGECLFLSFYKIPFSLTSEHLRAAEIKARTITSLRFPVAFVFKRKVTILRDISEHEFIEQI